MSQIKILYCVFKFLFENLIQSKHFKDNFTAILFMYIPKKGRDFCKDPPVFRKVPSFFYDGELSVTQPNPIKAT